MDLREIWWEAVDWIHLAQALVHINNKPSGSINSGEFLD
jgi:hypothetical protein